MIEKQTGELYFVDNGVANTVDFWYATNTYLDLADKFIDHLAATKVWNSAHHKHDPISSQTEFFHNFALQTLGLLNDESNQPGPGALDTKIDSIVPIEMDAQLNDGEDYLKTGLGSYYERFETRVNPETKLAEVLVYNTKDRSKTRWVPVAKNDFDRIAKKTQNISSEWGSDSPPAEQLIYWLDKFRTAHHTVKEEFYKLLPEGGTKKGAKTKSVFDPYSDSLGTFGQAIDVDTFCIPFGDGNIRLINDAAAKGGAPKPLEHLDDFDDDQDDLLNDTVPNAYSQVLEEKLTPATKALVFEFSKKTETIFRRNIRNVIGDLPKAGLDSTARMNGHLRASPTKEETSWKTHVQSIINDEALNWNPEAKTKGPVEAGYIFTEKRIAHGENLVGDYLHMLRMNDDIVAQYNSIIRDNLGRLWDAFQFIKLASEYDPNDGPSSPLNNQMTLQPMLSGSFQKYGVFDSDPSLRGKEYEAWMEAGHNKVGVEGVMLKADLLQTKLQETQKQTTNAQILSSTDNWRDDLYKQAIEVAAGPRPEGQITRPLPTDHN